MKTPVFTGTCTALITPFDGDTVSYPTLDLLIDRQLKAGVEAIAFCATTGEAPTMTDEEKCSVFRHAVTYIDHRCRVIAGTGSNDTAHAITLSKDAEACGVDGLLVVSPYYNKATEAGLIAHYQAIAKAVNLPIIVYNVPSRTGVDISLNVYRELSLIPNLNGVKEASGNLVKVTHTIKELGGAFYVWSGNDDQNFFILSLGGVGVISVLSNLCPSTVHDLTEACRAGDFLKAKNLHLQYQNLTEALFCEVNPIPIKEALTLTGLPVGLPRLPLCEISPAHRTQLKRAMDDVPIL